MVSNKMFLMALAALLCMGGITQQAFADQTADMISSLRAKGFNDNEIAVYRARNPEQFASSTTTSVPTVAISKNTIAVVPSTAHASAVLADLRERGYNLKELLAFIKQHPEIFPPNVDSSVKKQMALNALKEAKVKPVKQVRTIAQPKANGAVGVQVKPVILYAVPGSADSVPKTLTPAISTATSASLSVGADIVSQLKARGFNPNEIAVYKSQHPELFVNTK